MTTNLLPPHDVNAESAVLGSVLVDPSCFLEVAQRINSQDFYSEKNQWIFEAMAKLGEGINHITVAHELTKQGHYEAVGGSAYLSQLVAQLPTSVHAEYYADIVQQTSFRRRMIVACGEISSLAYSGEGSSMELFTTAVDILRKLEPRKGNDIVMPQEQAERFTVLLDSRRYKKVVDMKFGFFDIDNFVIGIQAGDFVVVGARPSMGKSELLFETALHNIQNGKKVLIASAEMVVEQYQEREIAGHGIPIHRFRRGELETTEWDRLFEMCEDMRMRQLYYLEGRLTVEHIYNRAQLLQRTQGLDMIIVDYLQLLRASRYSRDLRETITEISSGLKSMAHELMVPVLAACQLNREVEARPDKKPRLSDIRESGSVEQDADVVLLLHRPEVYDPNKEKGIMHCFVAKTRQLGKVKDILLKWNEGQHKYESIAIEPELAPLPEEYT